MRLKKVKIRNFLSYRSISLEFSPEENLILITGYDWDSGSGNGVGKSALFDSILFNITGQTVRGKRGQVVLDDLIRRGEKDLVTECTFDNNWRITRSRSRKGTKVVIRNPEGEPIQFRRLEDNIEVVENLLGCSVTDFLNTHVFYSGNYVQFFSLPLERKLELVESLLNLNFLPPGIKHRVQEVENNVFDKLEKIEQEKLVLRTRLDQYQKVLEQKETIRKNLIDKIHHVVAQINSTQDLIEQRNQELLRIESKRKQLTQLGLKKKEKLTQINSHIQQHQQSRTEFYAQLTKINGEMSKIDTEIKKNEKKKSRQRCPWCFQKVDPELVAKFVKELQNEKNSLIQKASQWKVRFDKESSILRELDKKKAKIEEELNSLRSKVEGALINEKVLREKLRQLNVECSKMEEEKDELKLQLKELEKIGGDIRGEEHKLINLTKEQLELKELVPVISVWKEICANKGRFKKMIVREVIRTFSSVTQFYLRQLLQSDMMVEFVFEREFGCLVNNRSYWSYSMGERRSIDISLLLGILTLLATSRRFAGIILLDEIIDKLSGEVVVRVLRLLKEFSRKIPSQIFFITHNKTVKDWNGWDRVIWLEKKNGITSVGGTKNAIS